MEEVRGRGKIELAADASGTDKSECRKGKMTLNEDEDFTCEHAAWMASGMNESGAHQREVEEFQRNNNSS